MKDLDGKPLRLKADLGAFKRIQKLTGKNPFVADKGDNIDPAFMSAMLYSFAKSGGSNVTTDYIDGLSMDEIMKLQEEMTSLMGESMPEKKGNVKGQS